MRPIPVRVDENRRAPSEPPQPQQKSLIEAFLDTTGLRRTARENMRAKGKFVQPLYEGSPLQQLKVAVRNLV